MFVIGDCGDISTGAKAYASLEEISQLLVPDEASPIECHVLQMRDPKLREENKFVAFKAFHSQLNEGLQRHYEDKLRSRFVEYDQQPSSDRLCTFKYFSSPINVSKSGADREVLRSRIKDFVADRVVRQLESARNEGRVFRQILKRIQSSGDVNSAVSETARQLPAEFANADLTLLKLSLIHI